MISQSCACSIINLPRNSSYDHVLWVYDLKEVTVNYWHDKV